MTEIPKFKTEELIASAPETPIDSEVKEKELRNESATKAKLIREFRNEITSKNKGNDNLEQAYELLKLSKSGLLEFFGIKNLTDFLAFMNAESVDEAEQGYSPNRVKVFGDSQVEGMKYMGGLGTTLKCSDHRGKGISFIYNHLARKLRSNPRYLENTDLVYIHAGGNSLWTLPLEAMKTQVQALHLLLHKKAPNTRVVFGTITPRQETIDKKPNKSKLKEKLLAFNDWLRSTYGRDCFDTYHVVEDPDRPTYQNPEFRTSKTKTNVHFNTKGYRALTDAFLKRFKIGKRLEN